MQLRLAAFAAFAALAAASAASAEVVEVRAGDHGTFSRLVLYFEDYPEWQLGRVEDGYELRTDAAEAQFDLSSVFSRIPRDRIAALLPGSGPGALRIRVDCDCSIDAFPYRDDALVIDVVTGPAEPGSPFEQPLEAPTDAPLASGSVLPVLLPPEPLELVPGALAAAGATDGALLPRRDAVPPAQSGFALSAAEVDERVAATGEALRRELGRAVAQGLVEPQLDKTEAAVSAAGEISGRHVAITTAMDRAFAESAADAFAYDPEAIQCVPDAQLAIGDWGTAMENGTALFAYRENLLAEFDEASPESVAALARHYIYLTFGAEARAVLAAFPTGSEHELLTAMADIVDDGATARPGPLAGQQGCDGAAALWATLARPSLRKSDGTNAGVVAREFGLLPVHLRRHLGPALAERFLAIGDEQTVAAIRNAITRVEDQKSAGVEILEARIAVGKGQTAPRAELKELATQNSAEGLEATILLLESQVASGIVDPVLVDQVAALAYENRRRGAGPLYAAEVEGRIALGQFDRVLPLLENDEIAPARRAELSAEAHLAAAEALDDAGFLPIAFGAGARLGTSEAELGARRAVAERLVALGFPQQARDLVLRDDVVPAPGDRMILAAAAFSVGDTPIGESYLAGLSGEEVDALREAYGVEPVLPGDPAPADGAAAEAGAEGTAADAAPADLATAEAAAEPGAADSAELAAGTAAPGAEATPLAEGRRLLEESQGLRARLDARLAELRPQE